MTTFVTAHGDTGTGEDLYVNCDDCGAYEPLGLGFSADDDVIEEAVAMWQVAHCCGSVSEYGLREFPNEDKSARYFGLPDAYR